MECPNCKEQTPGIIEGNHLWCNHCGVAIRSQCQYVPSYGNRHSCTKQIYSRVKRFTKYLQGLANPNILSEIHAILDLYSSFEFAWSCNKTSSVRIYFFAKPVMVQAICSLLDIETDTPSLKDKLREVIQHEELKNLQNTAAWKMSTGGHHNFISVS